MRRKHMRKRFLAGAMSMAVVMSALVLPVAAGNGEIVLNSDTGADASKYQVYLATVDTDLEEEDFTQDSWSEFIQKKNEAGTVFTSGEATAEELQTAYRELVNARDALVPTAMKPEDMTNDFSEGLEGITFLSGEQGVTVEEEAIRNAGNAEVRWIDSTLPFAINGEVSADITVNSTDNWRVGLMFRAADNLNYTFVAFDSDNALRIREATAKIDGVVDLHSSTPDNEAYRIPAIDSQPLSFRLTVKYYGDNMTVIAGDTVLYDGLRPQAVRAAHDGTIAPSPNYGGVGVYGWADHDFTIDNLTVSSYKPAVRSVTFGEMMSAEISQGNNNILCHVNAEADLTAVEPVFEIMPEGSTVSPEGPQDFSKGPVTYRLTAPYGAAEEWTVTMQRMEGNLQTITDGNLTVWLNADYPQVYSYELDGKEMAGAKSLAPAKVTINDKAYTPSEVDFQAEADSATYVLTIENVDLDGTGDLEPREVRLTYEFALEDGLLVKRLLAVEGDDEAARFSVALEGAILSAFGEEAGDAQLAFNGDQGTPFINQKIIYDAATDGNVTMNGRGYAFVSNQELSGSAHWTYQYLNPFTAKVENGKASIYEEAFPYRLADGIRPVQEVDGKEIPVEYECKVYLCGDENESGTVDWQDSAMWVREQIPAVPEDLREFFNGGNWFQAHGAFGGNGEHNVPDMYSGLAVVRSTPEQLVELQRQINNMTDGLGHVAYCFVGWNGMGHDYGWPNINEVPMNPIFGDEESYKAAQEQMAEYGGTLGFHLNMTNMTEVSESYRRGTEDTSELSQLYGNASSSTGVEAFDAFGWKGYNINHYMDLPYALNRQDAFVERFHAPFILYQDVMLPNPKGEYGTTEEYYAMRREINHWENLGIYAATEYYYPEKRGAGQYLMKNFQNPNVVDAFITAGQGFYSLTRNYGTATTDYIWAFLYSDDAYSGNIAHSTILEAPEHLTGLTYMLSNVNAYVAQHDLLQYVDGGSGKYTLWSDGIKFWASDETNEIVVTKDGVVLAELLDEDSTTLKGDVFVPAVDGSNRIFAWSTDGTDRSWTLLDETKADSYELYRMTGEGRIYVGEVVSKNGRVQFTMEPGVGYVLEPSDGEITEDAYENVNQNTDIAASSRDSWTFASPYDLETGVPTDSIEAWIPAIEGGWDSVIYTVTDKMLDADGNLRYHKYAAAGMAADNLRSTFWQPKDEDISDGEAWIQVLYPGERKVNCFRLDFEGADSDTYTILLTDLDGNTLYSGEALNHSDIILNETAAIEGMKLTIYTDEGFRLQEFGAWDNENGQGNMPDDENPGGDPDDGDTPGQDTDTPGGEDPSDDGNPGGDTPDSGDPGNTDNGDTNSGKPPKTGDTAMVLLWLSLALSAIGLGLGMYVKRNCRIGR